MKEYTLFKVGDSVRTNSKFHELMGKDRHAGVHEVTGIQDVPKDEIKYDPISGTGGVGHPQWVWFNDKDGERQRVSGCLLELAK